MVTIISTDIKNIIGQQESIPNVELNAPLAPSVAPDSKPIEEENKDA